MSVIQDAPPRPPRGSRRSSVVGIAVIGLVAGIAFFGGRFETSQDQQATTTTTIPAALADQVPGLSGTLHAIVTTAEGRTTYLEWPTRRSTPIPTELPVPGGRFNADASRVAALDRLSGAAGNLWLGAPGDVTVVSPDVTAFAWHDSDPDRIAATRNLGGVHQLWVGVMDPVEGFRFGSVATLPDATVVDAMGTWGFALHSDEDRASAIMVLDRFGTLAGQYEGTAVGQRSGEGGGIVIDAADGGDPVLGYGPESAALRLPAGGRVRTVDWFGDGARLAVGVEDRGTHFLRVIEADRILSEARVAAASVDWTPDGRFVVVRTPEGRLSLYDTQAASLFAVPIPGTVIDALVTGSS